MKHILGQVLKSIRRERKVPQHVLAQALGVTQQSVSQWERGNRPFPRAHLDTACTFLGVTPEQVGTTPTVGAIRILLGARKSKRVEYRPPYPIGAHVEHMTTTGRLLHDMHERVKAQLAPFEYDEVAHRFPRDSRHELAFVFDALDRGAGVVHTSTGRFRLPLNTLHDERWTDGHDLLQPALLWERGDERLVIFGQPWINLPWDGPIRPDFLVWYKRKGKPGYWLYVEIDDDSHRDKEYRNKAKALAINLVGLRYENYTVSTPGFFERFLRDTRSLRDAAKHKRREARRRARVLRERRQVEAQAKLDRS